MRKATILVIGAPAAADVRAARVAAGLTQTQAAALVHTVLRTWQTWESTGTISTATMHPGLWELFLLKTRAKR